MLSKLQKYGPANLHDALKFAAILLMLIDHVGKFFFHEIMEFRAVGRASAPIWFYLIGRYKPSEFKYDLIIYFFAMGFAGYLIEGKFLNNILLSLVVVRLVIILVENNKYEKNGLLFFIIMAVLLYIPTSLVMQYGSAGFLLAMCGYLQRKKYKPQYKVKLFFIATAVFYIASQCLGYGFDTSSIIICSLCVSAVMYLIYNFSNHKLSANYTIIALLGRYSLEIYAFHLLAFIFAAQFIK
jgi:hypothetical protein